MHSLILMSLSNSATDFCILLEKVIVLERIMRSTLKVGTKYGLRLSHLLRLLKCVNIEVSHAEFVNFNFWFSN